MPLQCDVEAGSDGDAQVGREIFWPLAALPMALLVIGCAGFSTGNPGSLFVRLGGLPQIEQIVDDTISRVATDPRLRRDFAAVALPALRQNLTVQVCAIAGGPCRSEGESSRTALQGLGVTDAEFDAVVTSMRAALDRRVGEREKNEMLRLLAPMKRGVVKA